MRALRPVRGSSWGVVDTAQWLPTLPGPLRLRQPQLERLTEPLHASLAEQTFGRAAHEHDAAGGIGDDDRSGRGFEGAFEQPGRKHGHLLACAAG